MAAAVRPYNMTNADDGTHRLIVAISEAQAKLHIASPWSGKPATAMEVGKLMAEGVRMETAGEKPLPALPANLPSAADLDLGERAAA